MRICPRSNICETGMHPRSRTLSRIGQERRDAACVDSPPRRPTVPCRDHMPAFGTGDRTHFDEIDRSCLEHTHIMVDDHHGVAIRHEVAHHARRDRPHSPGAGRWTARRARRARRWCGCARRGPIARAGVRRWTAWRSGAIEREVAESELQQPAGHIEEGFDRCSSPSGACRPRATRARYAPSPPPRPRSSRSPRRGSVRAPVGRAPPR